jgi:nucleoside-diphosphate-sugar epimerase
MVATFVFPTPSMTPFRDVTLSFIVRRLSSLQGQRVKTWSSRQWQGPKWYYRRVNKFHVTKVTLTASSACVIVDYGAKAAAAAAAASPKGNHIYTDNDWSPLDILEQKHNWYSLSKLLAEKKAWEISNSPDCTFKLCVLNPSLIWGPMIPGQPHLNTSSQSIVEYMDGSHRLIQNGYRCVVDVRDVAEAHIIPIENDVGWGRRFLLFGGAPHFQEIAAYVKEALLDSDHPNAAELADNVPPRWIPTSCPLSWALPQTKHSYTIVHPPNKSLESSSDRCGIW